jgi:dTDP-4-dehydrorhamnose 3,5-epimerase
MDVVALDIPDVKILKPRKFADARGFLSETFNRAALAEHGLPTDYYQENHSLSADAGTVRGLHFQIPPVAQGKLVRVLKGAILDVAVDLRRDSPTVGRHVKAVISAADWTQIYVPPGFAHGFCTLEPDTEVLYKLTDRYSPPHERGVAWDDPALDIEWPVAPERAVLSERDRRHPPLAASDFFF